MPPPAPAAQPAPLASPLPPDHPDRAALAAEVHARPPEPLAAPARATYVAVRIEPEARAAELAHLGELCRIFGIRAPAADQTQWAASMGTVRMKWERHGEFSSYTFFAPGLGDSPFSQPVAVLLPAGWLRELPGRTICAVHAELLPVRDEAPDLMRYFGGEVVMGARIGDGAGEAYTDFVIRGDGFGRVLMLDRGMSARQAGRMLQRLFEIEAYRMMSLLALPVARALWPRLHALERTLAALTGEIADRPAGGAGAAAPADARGDDEVLLQRLTALAAEVERALAEHRSRFNASRAYHALVTTRIAELREQRLPGLQTVDEFMTRRLSPAMATCATTAQRLHDLSERVAQASGLLSTRVSIARERQNQALLAATARRAKLQLRLQQTVEGLSVAAITYYAAGLVGYVAKGAKAAGLPVSPDLVVGLAVPVLGGVLLWLLQRLHHRLAADLGAD